MLSRRLLIKGSAFSLFKASFIRSERMYFDMPLDNQKCIAVGISGGVDSAVTALIMKKKGFHVTGIHMQNWDPSGDETLQSVESEKNTLLSCFEKDEKDANRVCKVLGIPLHVVSFSSEYWTNVWDRVVKEYQHGLTPNPDILCNQHIKSSALPEFVKQKFGITQVATGHYARKETFIDENGHKVHKLLSGKDPKKDQAYFLCQVTQARLASLEFPLGDYTKEEVKQIAKENNLEFVLDRRESMGICFVGKRKGGFQNFLNQYIEPRPGNIIYKSKVIAQHSGLHTMTIGEGARLGGSPQKLYCIGKNLSQNQLIVGEKEELSRLSSSRSIRFVTQINWITGELPKALKDPYGKLSVHVQCKNLGKKELATISLFVGSKTPSATEVLPLLQNLSYQNDEIVQVDFANKTFDSNAAGQYMAFFIGEEIIGSGKIFS